MNFRNLDINIRYRSDINDFPKDFLIPVLKCTKLYKRSVGFFSTSALVELSTGLFAMAQNGGKVQLICSPKLTEEDIDAINKGYVTRDAVIMGALETSLTQPLDLFEEERLNLIANMIASGMLDLKLAFMDTEIALNIYHEKIAVYVDDDGNKICFTGSMNESANGFEGNFESIYTFCSWKDQSQRDAIALAESDFDNLWNDHTKKLKVVPFPDVIIEKLKAYKRESIDYATDENQYHYEEYIKRKKKYHVPEGVSLRDYQREAVDAWFRQDCKGIFSMCTGAGKTFTALSAMVELAKQFDEKLAVFIVCPFIHLVSQWEEDVVQWGFTPIIAHSKSTTTHWEDRLRQACRRFKRDKSPFICITTNDTFAGPKLQPLITKFTEHDSVLFIVDEAHNFGAEALAKVMPENIKYRIALSATIKRHMDKAGTERLFRYFGNECIVYNLDNAIDDGALVPYDYFPLPVYLQQDEYEEYRNLSRELMKHIKEEGGKLVFDDTGKFILFKRTRLLAGARSKVALLLDLMEPYKDKRNILVYCGATTVENEDTGEEDRQIEIVTNDLRMKLGMSVQRFTSEEGLAERQNIKSYFQDGLIQVITAIKCLDEGVNIPGIETAFIMSSSRNPKEFIQRRGRLLRKSPGKKKAVIYDFVTLPRDLDEACRADFEIDRSILLGEMARIREFGSLAKNPEEAEALINRIMDSYDTYVDIEAEIQKQEEEYGSEG